MILGLSHVALTVNEMDQSLQYYQTVFGMEVLSDAERKGEWIDKVTGIPGFHTRTVYVSVAPYQHLELFGFYHPKTLPAEKERAPRVGISYCAFMRDQKQEPSRMAETANSTEWPTLMWGIVEEPYRDCSVITLLDPNGLVLRVIESGKQDPHRAKVSENRLLYPALTVESLESSIEFYRDLLGLEIDARGESLPEKNDTRQGRAATPLRWVLLKSATGPALKLIQPLNVRALPAPPWQMERVGFTHVAFAVQNLEPYYGELVKRGVHFKSPPQGVTVGPHKDGKVVYLSTPEGITLEFLDSPLTLEQAAYDRSADER
jgi:catechol 2,3-dioxygenase-like lactoylglutathione lyase family enzyme